MDHVWIVHHVRPETEHRCEDVKLIGVYRTEADGEADIRHVRDKPGFREWPHDFTCVRHTLGSDGWTEGFVTVRYDDLPAEDAS